MDELWVLGSAILVGFQAGSGFYQNRRISGSLTALIIWSMTLGTLFVLWYSTAQVSLQAWWLAAGFILIVKAAGDVRHNQSTRRVLRSVWVEPLEAIGTLFVLIVGTGHLFAVIAGFLAGFLLPFILQDWLAPLETWGDVVRTVSLGAVGLEDLSQALWPASWPMIPHIWWMIPWLLWWELSDWLWRDSATTWPTKQLKE